jgi:hypothetical protein
MEVLEIVYEHQLCARKNDSSSELPSPQGEREPNPDIRQLELLPSEEKDFRRKGASRVRDFQFALAVSGISQARKNIFFGEIGKFTQNIGVRQACHTQ